MELEAIISELKASKLEGENKFKEAYNTGIDVAIGVVERWQNIFQNCIERGEHDYHFFNRENDKTTDNGRFR